MKPTTRRNIIIGLLLLCIGMALGGGAVRNYMADKQARMMDKIQTASLEKIGAIEAERENYRAMAERVPGLEEQISGLLAVDLQPEIVTRWKTREVPVYLEKIVTVPTDRDCSASPARTVHLRESPAPSPPQAAPTFSLAVDNQALLTLTDTGDLWMEGTTTAIVTQPGLASQRIMLPMDGENTSLSISDRLDRLLYAPLAPRMRWAVGADIVRGERHGAGLWAEYDPWSRIRVRVGADRLTERLVGYSPEPTGAEYVVRVGAGWRF